MNRFLNALRTVLWAAIGLGGRRADADRRVDRDSLWIIVLLALMGVVGLVVGLIALARMAAG